MTFTVTSKYFYCIELLYHRNSSGLSTVYLWDDDIARNCIGHNFHSPEILMVITRERCFMITSMLGFFSKNSNARFDASVISRAESDDTCRLHLNATHFFTRPHHGLCFVAWYDSHADRRHHIYFSLSLRDYNTYHRVISQPSSCLYAPQQNGRCYTAERFYYLIESGHGEYRMPLADGLYSCSVEYISW